MPPKNGWFLYVCLQSFEIRPFWGLFHKTIHFRRSLGTFCLDTLEGVFWDTVVLCSSGF